MTVVQHTLLHPDSSPIAGVTVNVRLVVSGYVTGSKSGILSSTYAISDAAGHYSIDLPPQSGITPDGTYYIVKHLIHPQTEIFDFQVPDSGPVNLMDILVTGLLPPSPGVALTKAYGDSTYLSLDDAGTAATHDATDFDTAGAAAAAQAASAPVAQAVPTGGTDGQVVTRVSGVPAWAAPTDLTALAAGAVSTAIAAGGILKATQPPELTRNLAPNPQVAGGGTDNPASTHYTLSQTTTGLPAGFAFGAKSVRKGSNDTGVADMYLAPVAGASADAIPVTPGTRVSASVVGWCNDPLSAGTLNTRLRLRFYDSSDTNTPGNVDGTQTVMAASTFEIRKNENALVPAGATHMVPELIVTAAGGVSTTGAVTIATAVIVTLGSTVGTYGDGTSQLWSWTGTPHHSQSIQVFKSKTDLDAMQSEVGAAATQAAVIHAGVVLGKNLYNGADANVLNDTAISGTTPTFPTSAGYRVTGWIPVTPATQITAAAHRHVFFADASHVRLSAVAVVNTGNDNTVATYTVPTGAVYARFDFKYTTFPNFQVELGASATSYEAYNPHLAFTTAATAGIKLAAAGTPDPLTLTIVGNAITIAQVVDGLPLVTVCGKTSSDQGGFGINTIAHNGVDAQNVADSITPVRLANLGTVGGDHGYVVGLYLAANPDGKTTADLGSRWHDTAGREYVLVAVTTHPSTPLMLLGSYTGGSGSAVVVSSTLPATDLTHVSGATHTTAIDHTTVVIGSAGTNTQLVPSTGRRSLSVWLDGKVISADGIYNGKKVEIRESYEILDYQSIYETSKANIGSALTALTIGGAVLVQNTYRWGAYGAEPGTTIYDELTNTPLGECGAVQSDPLAMVGKTTTRYVRGMGVVGGLDWGAGVDYTSYSTSNNLPASAALVSGRIPTFSMDTLSASGVVNLGFAMGYLPFGRRPDSASNAATRATHASTQLFDMRNTKKCYPAFTTGETGWGHLQVDWFKAYLSPAQVAAVLAVGNDALTAFAALDAVAGITA